MTTNTITATDPADTTLAALCAWLEKMPRRTVKDGQTAEYIAYDNVQALIEQARAGTLKPPRK